MNWKNALVGAFVLTVIVLLFKWWLMDWFTEAQPVHIYIVDAVTT